MANKPPNVRTTRRSARFPGLHIYHDVRNERYLLRDTDRVRSAARGDEPFKPVTASLRAWWNVNQEGPTCTAAGSMTGLCAAPHGYTRPFVSYLELYRLIQEEDRRNGRHYWEGATSVAAFETLRKLGRITEYRWGYTLDTLLRIIAHPDKTQRVGAFMGTGCYASMFEADAEGIVRVNRNSAYVGGHFYFVGAYDAKRALADIYQTWGTDRHGRWKQKIPVDELYPLLRDDGEFAAITEVPKTQMRKAA